MRLKLQLVLCNDQGEEETVTDVLTLNKHHQRIEHLGSLNLRQSVGESPRPPLLQNRA